MAKTKKKPTFAFNDNTLRVIKGLEAQQPPSSKPLTKAEVIKQAKDLLAWAKRRGKRHDN